MLVAQQTLQPMSNYLVAFGYNGQAADVEAYADCFTTLASLVLFAMTADYSSFGFQPS